ncbi:MAG: mechanosensitive ion channel [Alphaproteobacteria bacterium]|nr:mechanosensitive ion channel [Alphaproteobacteria bacterium]
MKNLWIGLIKPKGIYAKWLLLVTMIGIMWFWTQGHFAFLKEHLDTSDFTATIGSHKISAYVALKALFSVIVIIWVTAILVEFSDNRILKMKKMRVANKALFQKISQIIIYLVAFLFTLNILGINLTSLTILSGALGIGLGFGLQKIASNFVSGMILLLERAIKPGDLLELQDGTFGYVRKSSSRSTLIETVDGKEVIVPNEEFIVNQVVNWTLSKPNARVTINFGVSYNSDIAKARDLALEAAKAHPRCMEDPAAVCWLDNFGDSSVDFILYFWIKDINDGLKNVKSEIMFEIWNKFKENNIEIPFPQRDLNLRTSIPFPIQNPQQDNGK